MKRGLAVALPLSLSLACGSAETKLPCDVTGRACQQAIFNAVAQTRGQARAHMPAVRVIAREQLADELRASAERSANERSDAEASHARKTQRGLALLGLMPEPDTQSADDAYIAQSVASIAAYYSHSSHDVTVIADQADDPDDATITLAHEFVHALQDQREGLSELSRKYVHATDDDAAFTSLVEGEATWLSYVTYYREAEDIDYTLLHHEAAFQRILDKTLELVQASSAPLLDTGELLPYPVGGEHVAALHIARGLPAVSALFAAPPLTLRAWVDDDYEGALLQELPCDLLAPPNGYARVDSDRLGFAGLLSLRIGLGESGTAAFEAARAWRGDQLATYAVDDDLAGSDDAVAVSWRVQLDSEGSARALATLVEASEVMQTSLQGSAVLILAATDSTVLTVWAPDACQSPDKSRTTSADATSLSARLRRGLGITR